MDRGSRVEEVLGSGRQVGLACTGGGSMLIAWLLNQPGASRAIVEAQVPYHRAALAAYLGAPGPHRVETATAVHLASEAWRRVGLLVSDPAAAVGLGCTAALATRPQRRGEDRAALAARTASGCTVRTLHWQRGVATREEQELLLSETALAELGSACGRQMDWPAWPPGVQGAQRSLDLRDPVGLLYAGEVRCVEQQRDGSWSVDVQRSGRLLLSGSFNPLHQGHIGLLAAAEAIAGRAGAFELSIDNVDKPALPRKELESRARQFVGLKPLVCTRAATFAAKVQLFGDCVFAVGFDTAARLFEPTYYGGDERMAEALAAMAGARTRFLVAGRRQAGVFATLADLPLAGELRHMFAEIPAAVFRLDLSSTELRAGATPGPAGPAGSSR